MLPEPSFYNDSCGGLKEGVEKVLIKAKKDITNQSRRLVVVLTMDKLTHLTPFENTETIESWKTFIRLMGFSVGKAIIFGLIICIFLSLKNFVLRLLHMRCNINLTFVWYFYVSVCHLLYVTLTTHDPNNIVIFWPTYNFFLVQFNNFLQT